MLSMIEATAIFCFMAIAIGGILCPAAGYGIGLLRSHRRSAAAMSYFVSEQRSMLASYYKVTIGGILGLIGGIGLISGVHSIPLIVLGMVVLCPATLVLMAMVPVGVTMGVALVVGASEPTPGYCPKCDYDLRGTPHGKCPECGYAGAVFRVAGSA